MKEILKYLQEHGNISGLEALDKFNVYRLSSVINRLRKNGHHIDTVMEKNSAGDKEYARYKYYPPTLPDVGSPEHKALMADGLR